jgi:hypothetical protein
MWMRGRFMRVPIRSIAEVSMVENNVFAIRGEKRPLRVRLLGSDHGVRLLLNDGSSRFIGFEYSAKALAAIQEAMKPAGQVRVASCSNLVNSQRPFLWQPVGVASSVRESRVLVR